VVDNREYPEHPFEDRLNNLGEILRELHALLSRKGRFVVHLFFHPGQNIIHVSWRSASDGIFDFVAVRPSVLKAWREPFPRASILCPGLFRDHGVQKRQLVEKIDCIHCKPFIHIFP
jgi:hypothetical protein